MTLTSGEIAAIQQQLATEHAADPQRSYAHYIRTLMQTEYLGRENQIVPAAGSTLTGTLSAIIELVPVLDGSHAALSGNGRMEGHIKEENIITYGSAITIHQADKLGLVTDRASAAHFHYGAGDPWVQVLGTGLPHVSVGQYLKADIRTTAPLTHGVQSSSTIASGARCALSAKASESALWPSTPGANLAYQAGVEWVRARGTADTTTNLSSTMGYAGPTLHDASTDFLSSVAVGDIIHLIARTSAPITVDGTIAGYYRVASVAGTTLTLQTHALVRDSEGVYRDDVTALHDWSEVCDYVVLRTAQEVVYLRHPTAIFTGINVGDWLHTHGTGYESTWRVTAVPGNGLLLLSRSRWTGDAAPYTSDSDVIEHAFFTATVSFTLTRAVPNHMAVFKIVDGSASFLPGVRTGDFVKLSARTDLLDPTQFPSKTPGIYKVAGVASNDTLMLDPQRYALQGGAIEPLLVSGSPTYFYDSLDDVAAWEIERTVVAFPSAGLFRVTGSTLDGGGVTTAIHLAPALYLGYGVPYAGDFTVDSQALAPFDDVMDCQIVTTYTDKLFVVDNNQSFTSRALAGDFVRLIRRSAAPATVRPNTNGLFQVESVPLPHILFLGHERFTGTEPIYQDSLEATVGNWSDACDYTLTRVTPSQYDRILLNDGTRDFSLVMPGDFVQITSNEAAPAGTWRVLARHSATELLLDSTQRYHLVDQTYVADSSFPKAHFDATMPYVIRRYASHTTSLKFSTSQSMSDVLPAPGLVNGIPSPLRDVLVTSYTLGPTTYHQAFAILGKLGDVLDLYPYPLTGGDGVYAVGTTPLNEMFSQVVGGVIKRPVADLDTALATRDLFRSPILTSIERAPLDAIYGLLLPSAHDPLAMVTSTQMALEQLLDVANLPVPMGSTGTDTLSGTRARVLDYQGQTIATLLADPGFQDGVAAVAVVNLAPTLLPLTFKELKDRWVDARLQELGYAAFGHYAGSHLWVTDKARNAVGAALATKIKVTVENVLRTRARPDLITSMQSQVGNLVSLLESVMPQGYTDPDRYFVQDGAIALDTNPLLGLPALFVSGFTAPTARARREAVKGSVGVPADASLRAKRRAYALGRNRHNFLSQQVGDLQNHRNAATNPVLQSVLDGLLATTAPVLSAVQSAADALQGFLGLQDQSGEAPTPPVDPSATDVLSGVFGSLFPAPDTVGATETLANIDEPAPVQLALLTNPGPVTHVTPASTSPSGPNITNLFDSDFQDFRRTGITMPLRALNADGNNRDQLSYIYLTDASGNPSGNFKFATSGSFSPGQYNHFMLEGYNEVHADKYQLTDTLSEGWAVFAFGKQPEVWSINGHLLNDMANDQLTRFRDLWDNNLRITVLANRNQRMAIAIPSAGLIIQGYGLVFQPVVSASQDETVVPFVMQILVSSWVNIPLISFLRPQDKVLASTLTRASGGALSAKQSSLSTPRTAFSPSRAVASIVSAAAGKLDEANILSSPLLREGRLDNPITLFEGLA